MTPKVTVTTKEGCCISCGRNGTLHKTPVAGGFRWRCSTCIAKRAARNREIRNNQGAKT